MPPTVARPAGDRLRAPYYSATVYTPRHFGVGDDDTASFLPTIEVADLVTVTESGLVATFLPLIFDAGHGSLLGHVARKNDQWKLPAIGEALVIAHGEDAYVSPGWYASKAEHGRVVPTWDYTTAHVYGELRVHDDAAWVEDLVRRLTLRHETGRSAPWSVDDAPEKFREGQFRAIVGIELAIGRVEAKFKLSQNRSQADIDGVVEGLVGDGLPQVAAAVERARPAP
ncbi:MAG TPA: FMN-binding negative transcriptional regulator [Gaiellaceae bacterium]|nr:FMN-binding negative transcriptional regulator [Gaiellaceae bacterium]